MTLANGWVLHFLWLLPVAGFGLVVQQRSRRRAMERFADPALLARLAPEDHKGKRFVKGLLLLLALGLLLLALAGPRWGSRYQEVSRKGVDIMMLVDLSRSMEVADVEPSRLERAKREIADFLNIVQGDRVGLTVFAGAAFVQCPLTLDYAALKLFLNSLQPGAIPVPGTDLGAAIDTGLSAFDFKAETDKVMLLITDGEDNEQRGLEAARKAARRGVRIFVFGIGDLSGGPVPAGKEQGGFKKDDKGQVVLSRLDERILQELASVTGGDYVRSVAGDLDLDTIYFDGIRQKTRAQTLKSGKIKIYEERFNVFVLAAFLLLLVEELMEDKRRTKAKKRFGFLMGLVACICSWALISAPAPASASETGTPDELYRVGRYAEAERAYTQGDMDHPKDIRYRYNRGCAAFQGGRYKDAAAAFTSAMKRTRDRSVRFKAAYNLGNTAFKQGDFASAAAYYKQAIADKPDNADARHNLELSLRALENAKQQPSETPENQSKPDGDSGEQKDREQGDPGKASDGDGREQERKTKDTPENQGEKQPDGSPVGQEQTDKERDSWESDRRQNPQEGKDQDLSGELKPLKALPERKDTGQGAGDPKDNDPAAADRKRAEALLDNVRENPAGILQSMVPGEDRLGPGSGRDW